MSNKFGLKKQREELLKKAHDFGDYSWATVELFRWQYGYLPRPESNSPLDISAGLRGMAKAFEIQDAAQWPAPFNVMEVLRYAAKVIEDAKLNKPFEKKEGA